MGRRLKVYSCSIGTVDRLVAAPNQRAAAESFGMSLYSFREYASETANEADCALALSRPGVLFTRSNCFYGDPWTSSAYVEGGTKGADEWERRPVGHKMDTSA